MKREKSCGAVVFTRFGDQIKYVMVRSLKGFWGFPKGHTEGAESEQETALREVREETGLVVQLLPGFRMSDEYPLHNHHDILKTVVYFIGEFQDQSLCAQESELSAIALMSFDEAMSVLAIERGKKILAGANEYIINYVNRT